LTSDGVHHTSVRAYLSDRMELGYKMEYLIEQYDHPIKFEFFGITRINQIYNILNHKLDTGEDTNCTTSLLKNIKEKLEKTNKTS
jgi:hypothetical protein